MARYIGSKTPLNAGIEWIDVLQAGREDTIVGGVFSDQGGTLNIEHSFDGGQNYDVNDSPITVVGGTGQVFERKVYGTHIRLRYTNGGTNQTVFRLSARFASAGNR